MRFQIHSNGARFKLIALLMAGLATTGLAGEWNDQVGLQLESLKSIMARDVPGTLQIVHDFGFKFVELVGDYHLPPEALTTELHNHQLTAISVHFPYDRFRDDPEGIASEAEKLGLKFAGCPSLPQKDKLDLAGCQDAVKVFNRAGEILARHNIQFFYHPHGYEFKPHGDGTFFDLLASETNPKFVHFQMDVFWIVHAGQDPLQLFRKYGARWVSMHLKDMKQGTPTALTSHAEKSAFVPIGQGQIDFSAVVQAAHKAGIKWFFIEDESATPQRSIAQSIPYLQKLRW